MLHRKKKYKVRLHGRSGVVYEEGERSVLIEAEMMAGPTDLVIYSDSIRYWQSPHEGKVISPDEKQRIKENITKELEDKGLNIDWE